MAFGVLFGSRMLPRMARGVAVKPLNIQPVAQRTLVTSASVLRPMEREALTAAKQVIGAPRHYGTRSVWNVAGGRRQLWIWFVAATAVAGFVQEVCGPYIFFHE